MDTAELIDVMRLNAFFAPWSESALRRLIEGCTLRTLSAGEVLWSVGEPGESAYILISGRVERVREARPSEPKREQFSEPGALLSLVSLLQGWPHTSAATAQETTLALELPRAHFDRLFAERHPAAFALADAVSHRVMHQMREVNDRLHSVFGQPAETLTMLRRRLREEAP